MSVLAEIFQRTGWATRLAFPAHFFAQLHDLGVKVIEQGDSARKILGEEFLHVMIFQILAYAAEARKNPFGVGIHDEHGLVQRIEQYGISRLRTNAIDC